MKTNHYESVVIINATLEDPQVDAIISSLEEQMTANGVEISDIEKWGRKRLAYPIQKGKSGYYIIFHFTSPREYIAKYERALRLDENVIRFLTIKLEDKDLEFIAKKKVQKEEEKKELAQKAEAEKSEAVAETVETEEKDENDVDENKESNE